MLRQMWSTLAILALSSTAHARVIGVERLIDFETDGEGNPFSDISTAIPFAEYEGVALVSGLAGINFVVESNPADENPFIEGRYLNIGAFASVPLTFLEIRSRAIRDVSFDFATASGVIQLLVWKPNGELFWFAFLQGLDPIPFTNRAGFPLVSGGVDFGALGIRRDVRRIQIRSFNQGLVFDNLRLTAAPEPSTLILLLLAAALAMRSGNRDAR